MTFRRFLILMAFALGAAYLAGCAVVASMQDGFIYYPSTDVVAPDDPDIAVVRIQTEDGETLVGWSRMAAPGQPTFLYFGGNGDRPELEGGRWRRIAEHGAGFLMVCYRGYSGSTGKPSEPGLHADARAGYDWLVGQGVAADDIVIHGFSLGSGPATRLAMERDARALVLEAPYTSIGAVAWNHLPVAPWGLVLRSRFPNRDWIAAVDEPILIAHGDADSVIPFAHGQTLAALATAPTTFVAVPGSDHATLTRDGLYDHIWAFLDAIEE